MPQIPKILKKLTSPQKYIFTEIINFNLRGKKKRETWKSAIVFKKKIYLKEKDRIRYKKREIATTATEQ